MTLKNKSHYILTGCPALDKSDNRTCQNCRHPKIEPGTEICNNIEDCTIKKIYRKLTQGTISAKDSVILNILESSLDIEKLKESFKAAIKGYHIWAYGWIDIEGIFEYANAAGKPFEHNVTEADIINTLKDEYRFYKFTQRDIYKYIYKYPDLEERFNVLVEDLTDADFPIDKNLFIGDSSIDEIIEECIREI